MVGADEVLKFWLDKVGPSGWYEVSEKRDAEIRSTFLKTWENARDGGCGLWLTYPSGTLAYIILMDQFPRNMFRGSKDAFATDRNAKAAAKAAIHRNWDLKIDEPARQFFYLPLMHAENQCDQDRCVRLICERMPEGRENSLLHARAHREIIRKFGRFPYRNDALERASTLQEQRFMSAGGYDKILRSLEPAAA